MHNHSWPNRLWPSRLLILITQRAQQAQRTQHVSTAVSKFGRIRKSLENPTAATAPNSARTLLRSHFSLSKCTGRTASPTYLPWNRGVSSANRSYCDVNTRARPCQHWHLPADKISHLQSCSGPQIRRFQLKHIWNHRSVLFIHGSLNSLRTTSIPWNPAESFCFQGSILNTRSPVCQDTKAKESPRFAVSIYWKASSKDPNLADSKKAKASLASASLHPSIEIM